MAKFSGENFATGRRLKRKYKYFLHLAPTVRDLVRVRISSRVFKLENTLAKASVFSTGAAIEI